MPYKSEKLRLSEAQDRRRRLSTSQQNEIRDLYSTGQYSWSVLAKMYECSKSRIGQIVNPEIGERVRRYGRDHWQDFQAPRDERAVVIREHRHYKQQLYLAGELSSENDTK